MGVSAIGDFTDEVAIGDVLAGKYRVDRVLGIGGMGGVVEATHLILEDRVALKFLHRRIADDRGAKGRFLREARAMVKVKSAHVARVLDVGELDSGSPYLVMEYVEGRPLDDLLAGANFLTREEVCSIGIQVCEALAAAHSVGIVHRDIKPSNLLVMREPDRSLRVKVVDFGISKIGGLDSSHPQLTGTHTMMGSPLYMSPEQMRSARDVDGRTDIWSLGVVLYRALSGCAPFEGDSLPEVCTQVLEGRFAALQEICPDLPLGLVAAVHRCLETSADKRFPDAAALAAALATYVGRDGDRAVNRCRSILQATGMGDTRVEERPESPPDSLTRAVTPRPPASRELPARRPMAGASPSGRAARSSSLPGDLDCQCVTIDTEQDIVRARSAAKQLATQLGFPGHEVNMLITVVSELARNIVKYAGSGKMDFAVLSRPTAGLEITASDQGPGIANVESILGGSYVSKTGMGLGLRGSRKLVCELDVDSAPGRGTTVRVRKFRAR